MAKPVVSTTMDVLLYPIVTPLSDTQFCPLLPSPVTSMAPSSAR